MQDWQKDAIRLYFGREPLNQLSRRVGMEVDQVREAGEAMGMRLTCFAARDDNFIRLREYETCAHPECRDKVNLVERMCRWCLKCWLRENRR